MVTFSEAQGSV